MVTNQIPLSVEGLLGTWRLSACEGRSEDGAVSYPYSDRPEGMLTYNPDGSMMVLITKPGRPLFEAKDQYRGSDTEVREAFEGCLAYCGRFSVDAAAGSVTHHIQHSMFPNWIDTQQVRFAKLTEGQLALTSPPFLAGGKQTTFALIWRR